MDGVRTRAGAGARVRPTAQKPCTMPSARNVTARTGADELFAASSITREIMNEPHAEISFEDFLAKRMKGKAPLRARLDSGGHAVIKLASGNWWLHATMADGDNAVEWRLPVTVAGNKQTVELTKENAYERSKKF